MEDLQILAVQHSLENGAQIVSSQVVVSQEQNSQASAEPHGARAQPRRKTRIVQQCEASRDLDRVHVARDSNKRVAPVVNVRLEQPIGFKMRRPTGAAQLVGRSGDPYPSPSLSGSQKRIR